MKAVIGLGNPEEKYRDTRHNIGFMVLDKLAESRPRLWSAPRRVKKGSEPLYEIRVPHDEAKAPCLVRPLTYMNRSGLGVKALFEEHAIKPESALVISDEVQLKLGRIKIGARGTAGGHNGLKSIIEETGSSAFPRLRVGIEWNRDDINTLNLAEFVLGSFVAEEKELIERTIDRAVQACWTWFNSGAEAAMNLYNSKSEETKS